MELEQSLTKENFWNEMMDKYPHATKMFCDWIDEYKKAVGWDALFGAYETKPNGKVVYSRIAPKFHDLPNAMQLGIWIVFVTNIKGGLIYSIGNFLKFNLRKEIESFFEKVLEKEAKDAQKTTK